MPTKVTFFLLLSFFFLEKLAAQPQPCTDPPMMTSFCSDACIICDIDGFEGRHESNSSGEAPPDFCTVVVHNAQWIAFIAGSTNLEIQLAVSNCTIGAGLEVSIYEGNDCSNYNMVSNCLGAQTAIAEGTSGVFTTNEPLVIGQYYYLVMDGAFGDNCDWRFTVLEGSTQVAPLDFSGNILGETAVCPSLPFSYKVDFPSGATAFDWTMNGDDLNVNADSIEYTFPNDGMYTLCVTSKNACDEAPPNCTQILVESVPTTEIEDILCEGDSFIVANTVLYEGGFYEFNLTSVEGCDSLVIVDLTEIITPILNIDLDICDGDTLFIGNIPFTQTGTYQEILTTANNCDSIVNLDLLTITCLITGTATPTPVVCFGDASGGIDFNVNSGTAPFIYSWENLNGTFSGTGNITTIGETVSINSIPKGTYLITIEDTFGNSTILISEVTEPSPLTLDFSTSDYSGFEVSCAGGNDGVLEAVPTGGIPNYTYTWINNQTTNTASNLTIGIYTVTLTDAVGCTIESNYELQAPSSLDMVAEFSNPICDGPATGSINVLQTSGGVSPYLYNLNGGNFSNQESFDSLAESTYEISVMDANGCMLSITDILDAPQIPMIDLGGNQTINLGESVDIQTAINNVNLTEIIWTPIDSFSCETCINPTIFPLNAGTYTLIVTSEDDCTTSDSIFIDVQKFRKFYAPTAFSPNFDGFNDFFTLFGGPEVAMIRNLTIFNRWGGVVFNGRDMDASIETLGWDGRLNGKDVNPDVYVWIADVLFIDGIVKSYSGDVTVVK